MFKYTWRNWTQEFVQWYKKFDSTLSNVLAITIFFQLVTPLKHGSSYQGEKKSLQVCRIEGLNYQGFELPRVKLK